jgi:hypothetical protein
MGGEEGRVPPSPAPSPIKGEGKCLRAMCLTYLPLSDGHRGREVTRGRKCALFFYTPHCIRYYDMVFQDI